MNIRNNSKSFPNISKSKVLNERVWQANELPSQLLQEELAAMQKESRELGIRQFRYCLHSDNDSALQQMVIFHNYPQVINWHCQPKGGIVFYYVIKGQIDIILSSDRTREYKLSSEAKSTQNNYLSMLSIPKNIFRRIITNSDDSIFLEISSGKFEDNDTIWTNSI